LFSISRNLLEFLDCSDVFSLEISKENDGSLLFRIFPDWGKILWKKVFNFLVVAGSQMIVCFSLVKVSKDLVLYNAWT